MIEVVRATFESSPLLALFVAIATGYAVGQISFAGVSFGAGAVLFTGLCIGAFAPHSAPHPSVGTLGLVMCVYGIGIQYGRQFVESLRGPGLKYMALTTVAVVASLVVAWALAAPLGVSLATAAGLFAGSGTSTPTLQAALAAAGNIDPTVGYSVAYPFGVAGPIILMTMMAALMKPRFEAPARAVDLAELIIGPQNQGRTVAELSAVLPADTRIVVVRHGRMNVPPLAQTRLLEGDGVLLVGNPASLASAAALVGREYRGLLSHDRSDYDAVRVYVSRSSFVGQSLGTIPLPEFPVMISHVRRGDAELVATADLVLEFGDRLVMAVPVGKQAAVRHFFGDSIKGNAELSFVSVGIGMALGVLLGMVPIPLPGGGGFTLGVAGGPLVVALVLGWLGRTGPIGWTVPVVANLVLRNLGLAIFIGVVAIGAGEPFVNTVAASGLPILLAGAAVLLTLVGIVLGGGYALGIPFDDLFGVCAGACGNPAILAAASRLAPTDRPDIGYAISFPCSTIVKIIAVQLLLQ